MRKALLGVALTLWLAPAAHAATRVIYASTWSGHTELYAIGPSPSRGFMPITKFHGVCPEPPHALPISATASPNGRYLAVTCGGGLWLMRVNGREARELLPPNRPQGGPSVRVRWSRDSRLLGYGQGDIVRVVNPVTRVARFATPGDLIKLAWSDTRNISPDGHWVAQFGLHELVVTHLNGGPELHFVGGFDARWSPDGKKVAVESPDGIRVVTLATRRVRLLTPDVGFGRPPNEYENPSPLGLAWSPDGQSIAYATGRETYGGSSWGIASGDLRIVTLKGHVRTLVSADYAYGSQMRAVAWVKAQTPSVKLQDHRGILAGGPIDLLAADGKRAAFEACDTIVVWTPATGATDSAVDPDMCAHGDLSGRYFVYDLALAGDRLLYGLNIGCNAITVTLYLRLVGPQQGGGPIAQSFGNCGAPFRPALGRAVGSGDLLVFGEWTETNVSPGSPFGVSNATVRRLDGTGCPCPSVVSTPGPLYPADVDDDRVLVYGDNETIVVDRDGKRLISLPVSPQAAQLSHNDLVLLASGELRRYDVRDGALLHTWKLPDVSSGPDCGWRVCETRRLVLNDVSHGRVAYILDGKLHLLRLSDGADAFVREASHARFMDDGLVYADGSRLYFVSYGQLPPFPR